MKKHKRNKQEAKYTEQKMRQVFEKLISDTFYLSQHFWDKKNTDSYSEDLDYIDIEIIYLYIRKKVKKNEFSEIDIFFKNVEEVYRNGDDYVKNFIEVGLFEGLLDFQMQDYCFAYNKWFGRLSQQVWNNMLDDCLGTEWRKEKRKK